MVKVQRAIVGASLEDVSVWNKFVLYLVVNSRGNYDEPIYCFIVDEEETINQTEICRYGGCLEVIILVYVLRSMCVSWCWSSCIMWILNNREVKSRAKTDAKKGVKNVAVKGGAAIPKHQKGAVSNPRAGSKR